MDDGKTVFARIPNPNAGPPFYTTASEVAIMDFVSWKYLTYGRIANSLLGSKYPSNPSISRIVLERNSQ